MSGPSIGFDRALKLDWLDLAASLVLAGNSDAEARDHLNAALQPEIQGAEALKKTVLVLHRIWYPSSWQGRALRDQAAELIQAVSPEERSALHWGLTISAYGFFRDTAATVGRLSRLQPVMTSAQILGRLTESYGDRAVVRRAGRHVIRTLVDWGVLVREAAGGYRTADHITISSLGVQRWLIEAAMRASSSESLPLDSIAYSPELFPFVMADDASQIVRDPRFELQALGGQRLMLSLAIA